MIHCPDTHAFPSSAQTLTETYRSEVGGEQCINALSAPIRVGKYPKHCYIFFRPLSDCGRQTHLSTRSSLVPHWRNPSTAKRVPMWLFAIKWISYAPVAVRDVEDWNSSTCENA